MGENLCPKSKVILNVILCTWPYFRSQGGPFSQDRENPLLALPWPVEWSMSFPVNASPSPPLFGGEQGAKRRRRQHSKPSFFWAKSFSLLSRQRFSYLVNTPAPFPHLSVLVSKNSKCFQHWLMGKWVPQGEKEGRSQDFWKTLSRQSLLHCAYQEFKKPWKMSNLKQLRTIKAQQRSR